MWILFGEMVTTTSDNLESQTRGLYDISNSDTVLTTIKMWEWFGDIMASVMYDQSKQQQLAEISVSQTTAPASMKERAPKVWSIRGRMTWLPQSEQAQIGGGEHTVVAYKCGPYDQYEYLCKTKEGEPYYIFCQYDDVTIKYHLHGHLDEMFVPTTPHWSRPESMKTGKNAATTAYNSTN